MPPAAAETALDGARETPRPPTGSTRALPRLLLVLAVAFTLAWIVTAAIERSHPSAVRDAVTWRPLDGAEALARQTGKPILYEFSAEWCGPCRQMQAEVFADPEHAAMINHSFVPVRVVDRMREDGRNPLDVQRLEQRFNVQAFPTLVVVDPDGGEIRRVEGYPGAAGVMRPLAGASTKYKLKKGQFDTGTGIVVE